MKLLRSKETWNDVVADQRLAFQITSSYSSMRNTFADMRSLEEAPHILKRIHDYMLVTRGEPYTQTELLEKWPVMDWLVRNLCCTRHLKQAQLMIYGAPNTHNGNLVVQLSKLLKVHTAPRRKNVFTGTDDNYDLWVFNEWNQLEIHDGRLKIVLDGQVRWLDSKYGRVIEKPKNVPVVLLGNEGLKEGSPDYDVLSTRLTEVSFIRKLDKPIESERLAPTLYPPLGEAIMDELGERFLLEQKDKLDLLKAEEISVPERERLLCLAITSARS